jgi:hypothetical protein
VGSFCTSRGQRVVRPVPDPLRETDHPPDFAARGREAVRPCVMAPPSSACVGRSLARGRAGPELGLKTESDCERSEPPQRSAERLAGWTSMAAS